MFHDVIKVWVDPPNGWKYGFPKVWDKEAYPDFKSWIISQGYPKEEYESYQGNYIRYWEAK